MVKIAKKFFTVSVVAMTIMWSVGLAALVPTVAVAVDCPELEAGDLFKVPGNSAVYLLNADMERMYFPNSEVYHTWYADFSGVEEIPNTCVDAYPAPSVAPYGVNYRAGSRLVKVEISPSVYLVEPGNKKTKIGSEEVAVALYGANWASKVRDVADVYWPNFAAEGTEITTAALHNGMTVTVDGTTNYAVVDGMLYEVDGTTGDVQTVSQALVDALEMGATTVTAASLKANPAQTVASEVVLGGGTPVATVGNLSVSLSANTSEAGNVVINVDNVVFGKFILKATSGDYTVASVKIGRTGLGAKGDFTSVTLYDGATKLGTSKTSWDSNSQTMVYNIPTGLKVIEGVNKELTVVAKLDTAGTYNSLGILAINGTDITPVYGNQMTGVSVSVGGVTISNMGTAATKKIGVTNVTLAEFKLTVSSTEDGTFKRIQLKNKAATLNASDDDVANLYLYKGATMLAGPVSMVSDKVSFVLDADKYVDIAKSKNEVFKVVGDIVNGDTHTLELVLENTTDLLMIGKTYGTSLSVHNDSYNAATEGAIITIDGAELNVAYTGTNLDTIDDVTDVNFGTLTLGAGSTDIKITSLILTVDETEGNATASDTLDVDNFELVETNGGTYTGVMTGGGDADADDETWTFSDEIYLSAGQTRTFTMQGDLPNGIGNGDSYKVTATINTTNVVAETVPAGDTVSNFSIGSITGKLITVKTPTLKVTGITQNNGTAVVNDTDVIIYKGTLEAQASDIKVSYANFDANTTFPTAHWAEIGFYLVNADGSYDLKQLLTTSQMSTGTLSFDSMDFTVLNGPTNKVTWVLKGKVASAVTAANGLVNKLKLDYFTGKASDNSDPAITSTGSDDLSTSGTYMTAGYRQITLADKGKLYLQMRNADAGFNKDRILLAGTSAWVGKLKLKADDESIKIKDLKLTNVDTSGADDDLASVCLYRAQVVTAENLISCQTVDSSGVVFYDDIDEVVAQGTAYWYIYVTANTMTALAGGEADSNQIFSFRIASTTGGTEVAAEGVRSGHTFTWSGGDASVAAGEYAYDNDLDDTYDEAAEADATAYTKQFIIAGTKISNVQLVSTYSGYTVDTILNGTDTFTVAILAVTTEATDNTYSTGDALLTLLNGVRFDVSKSASTTISAVTIQKIGGSDAAGALGVGTLSSDTSGTSGIVSTTALSGVLATDYKLAPGTTSYFVVKATVSAVSATSNVTNFIRFDLNDLKGTYTSGGNTDDLNNNIDWADGYTGSSAFNALLLDTEAITGTKVSKTNT